MKRNSDGPAVEVGDIECFLHNLKVGSIKLTVAKGSSVKVLL